MGIAAGIFSAVDAGIGGLYRFNDRVSTARGDFRPPPGNSERKPVVHMVRGILQIPFGGQFSQTLYDEGYYPVSCRYPDAVETQYTAGYPLMAAWALEHFSDYDGPIDAVIGHSAGGITAYLMAVLKRVVGALSGTRERVAGEIDKMLPTTKGERTERLIRLGQRLEDQGTRFISIGTPFGGIRYKPWAWRLIQKLIEPYRPGLYSFFRPENLTGVRTNGTVAATDGLYTTLGFQPHEVIDANLIGAAQSFGMTGPLKARLATFLLQGALAMSSGTFTEGGDQGSDRLVPHSSSVLNLHSNRQVVVHGANHLSLIERPDIAKRVANFLKKGTLALDV